MQAAMQSYLPNMISCSRKSSICELFPYELESKVHAKLSDGLKEYKLLLISAKESISHFLDGNLFQFDALVGENSCQIRATLLSILAHHYNPEQGRALLEEITQLLSKIDNLTKELTHQTEKNTLSSFINENNLDLFVNTSELYLVVSYILTKVRVILPPDPSKRIVRNESTETRKVKEISNVGSSFARDLVKKLRSIASVISVRFVQEISELLHLPENMIDMVSDKYCTQHDKFGRLKCLPCFWYTLLLMQYSVQVKLPLVLIVNQIHSDLDYKKAHEAVLYFNVIDGKYQEVPQHSLDKNSPALIILGSGCRESHEFPDHVNWRNEILNYNPVDLILSYAASHRQYPDETKDILITQDDNYFLKHYQSAAQNWGCALDNPSLFFLVHAFCDKVSNIDLHLN